MGHSGGMTGDAGGVRLDAGMCDHIHKYFSYRARRWEQWEIMRSDNVPGARMSDSVDSQFPVRFSTRLRFWSGWSHTSLRSYINRPLLYVDGLHTTPGPAVRTCRKNQICRVRMNYARAIMEHSVPQLANVVIKMTLQRYQIAIPDSEISYNSTSLQANWILN